QPALEGPVIGTSRLIDDAAAGLSQPVDEGCVALRVVAKATACAIARAVGVEAVGVEMVFRDVDADGIVRHLSLVLCLSSAAQPRVSVQASRERRGRSNFSSTRRTVSASTIRPSPLREGAYPLPAVPFSPVRQQKS